ncbi:MAG: hypothetical protein AB8B74_13370 [Crocinitomicaceae bacterium]
MNNILKILILFTCFVIHNKANGQYMQRAVTLMQAYSYQKIDALSSSKLRTLNIQLNRETIDFLSIHQNYSISDFKNLKQLKVEGLQGNALIDDYPVDFINNLNKEDTKIFQNWLNEISELDSLTKLSIPSFFKIEKIKNLNSLYIANYKHVDSSIYSNLKNVKQLNILSSTLKNSSIDFDFSNFKKLETLSLSLYSKSIKNYNLPDLRQNPNLKGVAIYTSKTDSIIIRGLLYGKSFQIHANDKLKYISLSEVLAVDSLVHFQISGSSIEQYDFTGLNTNSKNLKFRFRIYTTKSFDFAKLPQNTEYELIYIDCSSLTEVLFPSAQIKVSTLSLRSDNLDTLKPGIYNLEGLKKVIFYTPKLSSLANDLFKLKELESLTIHNSNFNRIPKGLENMPTCITLDMSIANVYRSDLKRLGKLKTVKKVTIYESRLNFKNGRKEKKFKEAVLKRYLPNTTIKIYK